MNAFLPAPTRPACALAAGLAVLTLLTPPAAPAAESLRAPNAEIVRVANTFSFTEGPSADRNGHVFFTDQPNDRIVRWDAVTGALTTWLEPAGRSNGTYFDKQGNLLTCADEKNELWQIAPDKSHVVLVRDFDGHLLNGPNDLWIRPDGSLYFTDPLYPRNYWKREPKSQQKGQFVYFLSADRRSVRPVAEDLKQPNGLIGSPDASILYVADIGAAKTYAYDIQPTGTLANKRLFCELGSDGMTVDREGNVYLTGKGVTVFDKNGQRLENIPIPEPWTANVTFGGKNRDVLFVTAGKSVYTLQMRVQGAP